MIILKNTEKISSIMKTDKYAKIVEPSIKLARKRIDKTTNIRIFKLDEKYQNLGKNKKYLLKTYGCQGNLADSEKLAGILEAMGFTKASEEIKIYFNQNAKNKIKNLLGKRNKNHKDICSQHFQVRFLHTNELWQGWKKRAHL